MGLIIAILENMQGTIDNEFPVLLKIVLDELAHMNSLEEPSKSYIQSILQTISIAFLYNAQMAFAYMEQNN